MRLRDHRIFFGSLGVLALGCCIGGARLVNRMVAAREAAERLERAREEWSGFMRQDPRPSNDNVRAIEADLAAMKGVRMTLGKTLTAGHPVARNSPAKRGIVGKADAYFRIEEFVQRMRNAAREKGVSVAPDERFGFADYANAGPADEAAADILESVAVVEALLRMAFDGGAREVMSVQRPGVGEVEGGSSGRASFRSSEDGFELSSRLSVAVPGLVETRAFRLGFIGKTTTLRAVLNRCADDDLPLVVRAVEVEEVPARSGAVDRIPVSSGWSRFTVTFESVRVVGDAAVTGGRHAAAGGDGPQIPAGRWPAPARRPEYPEWNYELFTPPEIYFHEREKRFVAAGSLGTVAPIAESASERMSPTAPLRLLAVKRAPFRLQLVGFAGDEASAQGVFQNVETAEVFPARAGLRVRSLGLTIEAFSVSKLPVALPNSMAVRQRVAVAVVHDERTGERVRLTSLERSFSDEGVAVVSCGIADEIREVRAGETFAAGGAVYRIEEIGLAPATMKVRQESDEARAGEAYWLTAPTDDEVKVVPTI